MWASSLKKKYEQIISVESDSCFSLVPSYEWLQLPALVFFGGGAGGIHLHLSCIVLRCSASVYLGFMKKKNLRNIEHLSQLIEAKVSALLFLHQHFFMNKDGNELLLSYHQGTFIMCLYK